MDRLYFSEIGGKETITKIDEIIKGNRQINEYLLLKAPTGVGKSSFAKGMLYDYCKKHNYKVLYLLPRTTVKDEFIQELQDPDKSDVITVKTYQQFENWEQYPSFTPYNIIICDECHYFISDSIFNPYTHRSLERIINHAMHTVRFFITATPRPIEGVLNDVVTRYFNGKLWKYQWKDQTPEQQLMSVKFLRADYEEQKKRNVQKILDEVEETENETEKNIFSRIPNGEKAIVFCDSAKYAHELYKAHKDNSMFICSKSNEKNKNFAKDIVSSSNPEAYQKMLHEHKFDCKYLFCTSALDVGFSIKDKQVKHIICLLWDWNGIVQAMGRKRVIDKDDTFTVYLKDYNNNSIGGLITDNKKKFEHFNYFREHGAQAYYDKYAKIPDPAKIIYYERNKKKEFAPAIDLLVLCYYADYVGEILNEINAIDSRKYKYQNWVLQQLGLPPKKDRTAYGIEKSLAALVAEGRVFVGNEGKKEIARIIGLCDDRGRLLTTPKKINPELQQMGVPYQIVKGEKDKETKKQTYFAQPVTAEQQAGACAESAQNAPQATIKKIG